MISLFATLLTLLSALAIHRYARWCFRKGYSAGKKDGMKDGYSIGRIDADNWWLGVEREVDRERVKMWRDEVEP